MYQRQIVSVALLGLALTLPIDARADATAGSCMESFDLINYQTKSPSYEQSVSSLFYTNRVTVFLLLSSG
jgi:hypothetical protein